MQLDTGAAVSVTPETMYNKVFTGKCLTETRPLKRYSGDQLDILSMVHKQQHYR